MSLPFLFTALFRLKRDVMEREFRHQPRPDLLPDRHMVAACGEDDVRAESIHAGGQRPHMQVVDAGHARRRGDRFPHGRHVHLGGRSFQKHPDGIAQQHPGSGKDEESDSRGDQRIGVVPAGGCMMIAPAMTPMEVRRSESTSK